MIRYVFDSPTKARLQEIGPRFTLKLRWLKKGLPSVTAPDGRIAHGGDDDYNNKVDEAAERQEEDDAMGDIGTSNPSAGQQGPIIPPLDQEQEYEWKWKWRVSPLSLCRGGGADDISQRWRFQGELSFCSSFLILHVCILYISDTVSLWITSRA